MNTPLKSWNLCLRDGTLILCGEFIEDDIFKDYIKTSSNPLIYTIGHKKIFADAQINLHYIFIKYVLSKKIG